MEERKTIKDRKIEYILAQCNYMRKNEKLTITEFGKRKDLKLYIHKNKDYNSLTKVNNSVWIETKKDNKIIDTTLYVSLKDLKSELERIYSYKKFKIKQMPLINTEKESL